MAVDREAVIAEAMRRLESGRSDGLKGSDPLAVYEQLKRGGFAAFKTAQRIVSGGGAR